LDKDGELNFALTETSALELKLRNKIREYKENQTVAQSQSLLESVYASADKSSELKIKSNEIMSLWKEKSLLERKV